jgi:hypothetical protein
MNPIRCQATSFALVLACVPLWTASGAELGARQIIGTIGLGCISLTRRQIPSFTCLRPCGG